jgi:hypothetical protein
MSILAEKLIPIETWLPIFTLDLAQKLRLSFHKTFFKIKIKAVIPKSTALSDLQQT